MWRLGPVVKVSSRSIIDCVRNARIYESVNKEEAINVHNKRDCKEYNPYCSSELKILNGVICSSLGLLAVGLDLEWYFRKTQNALSETRNFIFNWQYTMSKENKARDTFYRLQGEAHFQR